LSLRRVCSVCVCECVSECARVSSATGGYVDSIAMTMMTVAALQKAAESLLSSEKTDVPLLDQVVNVMNRSTGETQQLASKILTELKEQEGSWMRVDGILQFSQLMQTKYYALQILESLIQTRWKTLPREQCEGIKSFIVGLVIKISSDEITDPQMKTYLQKLNLVLVQIVKQEWPKHWPTFMTDIVGASKVNDNLCLNNMIVLRLLSEEVFDFDVEMTQAKAHHLKKTFCGEFQAVFSLCHAVMETSENAALVEATLQTLYRFLSWIPVGYIFETNIIDLLTQKFLGVQMFRCVTVQCLTEIAALSVVHMERNEGYIERVISMLKHSMLQVMSIIDPSVDLAEAYKRGTDADQKFIANLAQYLGTFLRENAPIVEVLEETDANTELKRAHQMALQYLLKISMVEDVEIFKVCLDYWNWLCAELYREFPFQVDRPLISSFPLLNRTQQEPPRRALYNSVLSDLRLVMISRMAKPEEVLVVENEQGEVVRELIKDTDSITLYKTMRETLVYLTHLDYKDTEMKMTEKLQNQVNGKEWSWKNLNTLCWAIGSISGAMMEEDEKRFLVTVIRDLLGLCEQKRGKDNKSVIASNIMYVVGQYPRFLRAHWKFLKTVINKLFEFMHETHEGVQDMACDTFIKVAHKCRRHFVVIQVGEVNPFIDDILGGLSSIICDLSPPQVHVFYEAVGCLISAQNDPPIRECLIERLMQLPNSIWEEIILHASQDINIMKDAEVVKNIANILKTNVAACRSIGSPFICQLSKIYLDMLNVYKVTSENISSAVLENGEDVLKQPLLKSMRAVKREILTLISTWVAKAEDTSVVLESFVPPLFDAVLFDYQRNCPAAREPKVLSLLSIIVTQLHSSINCEVIRILDAVFTCTLEMINRDMEEYPEHRLNFFKLLYALNHECFDVFVALPPQLFRLIVDAVVWAFKHSMRNVAEIGLDILKDMLSQFAIYPDRVKAHAFYKTFYVEILVHVLTVVADRNQIKIAGFSYYADILCSLFTTAEFAIAEPLNPPQSNVDYIYQHIGETFARAFPNLTQDQIRVTIKGFFSFNKDTLKMKNHLRDFLVQIKEQIGEDTSDLFIEEREQEIQNAQNAKNEVPGMMNPNDISDDDLMK
uniref:Importin N-terminal domain-containing protein n=3 Tax=Parascaris univalens TaxID=6257 RepID=A0A915ARK8_PARUN